MKLLNYSGIIEEALDFLFLSILLSGEFNYIIHPVCVCVGNENYTGIAARDTANALAVLSHAVRGVAAGTKNTQTQTYILSTAQQVWPDLTGIKTKTDQTIIKKTRVGSFPFLTSL